jgi:hypothetical protein
MQRVIHRVRGGLLKNVNKHSRLCFSVKNVQSLKKLIRRGRAKVRFLGSIRRLRLAYKPYTIGTFRQLQGTGRELLNLRMKYSHENHVQRIAFFLGAVRTQYVGVFHYLVRLCLRRGTLDQTQRLVGACVNQVLRDFCYEFETSNFQDETNALMVLGTTSARSEGVRTLSVCGSGVLATLVVQPLLFKLTRQAIRKRRGFDPVVPAQTYSPADLLAAMSESLILSYCVQHQALDRKLRKIVKNKYRYVRRYVYVRERDRLRQGLRLCSVARHLYGQRT